MINFIPIFPLSIVVYPGEALNLHIFEPRYVQLITECYAAGKSFGIPVVLEKGLAEMGTLVAITGIAKRYDDGKMDIHTKGLQVFRILELVRSVPEKLYGGAIVNYPENSATRQEKLMQQVIRQIRELHRLLNVSKDFQQPDAALTSYDIAHHAGLSLEEEYELLGLFHEIHRLEYMKRHLSKVLPVMTSMETLKKRIQLNGHFKELKGFNFDL